MSRLERYTLAERTKPIGRNPEWVKLAEQKVKKEHWVQIPLVESKQQKLFPMETAQPGVAEPKEIFNIKEIQQEIDCSGK